MTSWLISMCSNCNSIQNRRSIQSTFARFVHQWRIWSSSFHFLVQERLTRQIAEAIAEAIQPRGVCSYCWVSCKWKESSIRSIRSKQNIYSSHMCMIMRGAQKVNSRTTTSAMLGVFSWGSEITWRIPLTRSY